MDELFNYDAFKEVFQKLQTDALFYFNTNPMLYYTSLAVLVPILVMQGIKKYFAIPGVPCTPISDFPLQTI
jgi:hypothetical protein